jgi:hypothetical protein
MWVANVGRITASRSISAAVRTVSAEGLRCRLELCIHLSRPTTEAATRTTWIERTWTRHAHLEALGFLKSGAQPRGGTLDSLRPLSGIEQRMRRFADFDNRFARWKSIGSYAQAALPKSLSIRLLDKVI